MLFPLYQSHRGKKRWTLIYPTALCLALAIRMVQMGGQVRPGVAFILVGVGLMFLWRQLKSGWKLETDS